MAEPKNWEVEYQHGDGDERTGLMSDQELNRAERANGDHGEERPAADIEKDREQEAQQEREQAEREQRERHQEQERRKQHEKERQELVAELQQMREREAQQQREQAAEQARQRQEPGQEPTQRDQERGGGGRVESDEEAIRRITAEEKRTAQETRERRAQEKADLLKDMREGKEHSYGHERGSSSEEHTHYNPDLQQEAATRQYEDAVRQAGVGQAGGQNDSPEQSRGQSVPEQTQAPEMEMER
jgi:hypothetical protein